MTVTTITTPPTAPDPTDADTFDSRAEALVDWLSTLVSDFNGEAPELNAAIAAAANAIAAANATEWVSGTEISEGDGRYSPTDYQSYRAKNALSAGANTTDPASDPTNWAQLSVDGATFIDNYLSGLTLANNGTDSDHDIDVAVGIAADSTNAEYLELASAITKRIDATWASGTGNGGLSSSLTAPANNTWYHVFIVDIGGSPDVLFDTSVTCANGVTDHSVTAYRRIGSVRTNGSANIHAFTQSGDRFTWTTPFADVSDTSPGTSENTYTLTVPTGVKCTAVSYATVRYDSSNSNIRFYETQQADATPSNTTNGWQINQGVAQLFLQIGTDTSAQIHYRNTNAVDSIYVNTNAYIDTRGK